MAASSSSPIFIVGTPRSGTTLTALILRRHSALFMPGETHFFDDVYARRSQIGDPRNDIAARNRIAERLKDLYARYNIGLRDDQPRVDELFAHHDFHDRLLQATSYRDAFAIFMEIQCEAVGKRRWGNNVPRDLYHLETIFEFFPDAKIIACTRHLLDFLLSYRDKWIREERRAMADNAKRLRLLYHPVITALLWKSGMRTVLKAMERWPDRVILSRYEDLVADPSGHMARLCAFVGEPFEPEILDITFNNSSRDVKERGVFQSSVGRWRTALPASDAVVAQRLCRAELDRLGYRVEPIPRPPLSAVLACVGSAPLHLFRAMAANRERYGPMIPFVVKRLRTLIGA